MQPNGAINFGKIFVMMLYNETDIMKLGIIHLLCTQTFLKLYIYKRILTLSWRRPLSYRNQSIDLQSKSMDWFLYDNDLRHERVKG